MLSVLPFPYTHTHTHIQILTQSFWYTPKETYSYLISFLSRFPLAYLQVSSHIRSLSPFLSRKMNEDEEAERKKSATSTGIKYKAKGGGWLGVAKTLNDISK